MSTHATQEETEHDAEFCRLDRVVESLGRCMCQRSVPPNWPYISCSVKELCRDMARPLDGCPLTTTNMASTSQGTVSVNSGEAL